MPARERGPVSRAAVGVSTTAGKAIGTALLRAVTRGADPRHLNGTSVLDLEGHRSAIDFGSYAASQVGTQEWSGRPGRPRGHSPRLAAARRLTAVADRPGRRRRQLPMEVWLDQRHLRRVRFTADRPTEAVTLTRLRVAVDELDWSRLPTFRSPGPQDGRVFAPGERREDSAGQAP